MKVIRLDIPNNLKNQPMPALSLAIGYFDGVHIGHQKVINTAKELANQNGWKSGVMTFDPSPKEVLGKNPDEVKYITLLAEKINLIEKMNIDYLFIIPFTRNLANLLPEQFIDEYIVGLHVKHLVAGFDYTFGKFGKGTMDTIEHYSNGRFSHTTIAKVTKDDNKISSTIIRGLIDNGEVEKVPNYLGRFYTMNGIVIHGEKRGRTLGFPTANLQVDQRYVMPRNGVYIVRLYVNNKWVNGVASIGFNPTFNTNQSKQFIEVHLLDFDESIYGESVILEWNKRVRDEMKFDQINDLIQQMTKDKQEAIEYFQQGDKS